MLDIFDLPNDVTTFDSQKIEEIKSDQDITLRLYNENMHYTVTAYNEKEDLYTVTQPSISINASVNDAFNEQTLILPAAILSTIPLGSLFESFKSELNVIPLYNGEDLNIENEFISEYHGEISLLDSDTLVIYDKNTNAHLFYNPSQEHCFEVIHNDETQYFDSLDLALKFPYELALKEGYTSQSSRKRIDALKKFLETPEGIESIDELSREIQEREEKKEYFVNSGRYNEMLKEVAEDFKLRNIESISSEDFSYLKHLVTFIDEEEFHLMVDVSLSNGKKISNDEIPFENYEVRVGNLKFNRVIGQGTIEHISLVFG